MSQSARELRARASESGDRPIPASVGLRYPWWRLVVAVGVVGMLAILAVSQGSVGIPPLTVAKILASKLPVFDPTADWPGTSETILLQLRLPRVALAGIVGAALATSGAAYQGLFKNPLADPYLIGVASGAGLGATIVLITGVPLFVGALNLLPVAAFAGGLGAVSLAYMIARRSTGTPLTTLILAGVAIASLAGAATSLLMVRSDPDLRPLLSWLLGGFISARWSHSAIVLVYLVPAAAVLAV
ncbi:MAG TPA: iron ABC transporter, partial [Dehalococcoidia bacterium]|nr:iron ABC transporter [Dehalococcoidia bacterium]